MFISVSWTVVIGFVSSNLFSSSSSSPPPHPDTGFIVVHLFMDLRRFRWCNRLPVCLPLSLWLEVVIWLRLVFRTREKPLRKLWPMWWCIRFCLWVREQTTPFRHLLTFTGVGGPHAYHSTYDKCCLHRLELVTSKFASLADVDGFFEWEENSSTRPVVGCEFRSHGTSAELYPKNVDPTIWHRWIPSAAVVIGQCTVKRQPG